MKTKKPSSKLIDAAIALEEELDALTQLVTKAQKLPLDSLENLQKTGDILASVSRMEGDLTARLTGLMTAITDLNERQERQARALQERAEEFQTRRATYDALVTRYGQLGAEAQGLNALVQELLASQSAKSADDMMRIAAERSNDIIAHMNKLISAADELHRSALADGFPELERQANALRQQLTAARKRIETLAASLSSHGPDAPTVN